MPRSLFIAFYLTLTVLANVSASPIITLWPNSNAPSTWASADAEGVRLGPVGGAYILNSNQVPSFPALRHRFLYVFFSFNIVFLYEAPGRL